MYAKSHKDLHGLKRSVARVRKLSDRVIGIGPFGLGLDGVLGWVPGFGFAYSLIAGGFLMVQGVRAHASPGVLTKMAGLLLADSLTDVIPIPIFPAVADTFFTAHKWAADSLLEHIEGTLYYEGSKADAEADPDFRAHLDGLANARRAGEPVGKSRIVYLKR